MVAHGLLTGMHLLPNKDLTQKVRSRPLRELQLRRAVSCLINQPLRSFVGLLPIP